MDETYIKSTFRVLEICCLLDPFSKMSEEEDLKITLYKCLYTRFILIPVTSLPTDTSTLIAMAPIKSDNQFSDFAE